MGEKLFSAMKTPSYLPCLVVLGFLAGCDLGRGDIKSDPKEISLSASGSRLVLQGKWRNATERPSIVVPRINTARVECDKQTLICNEYIAKLIEKSDDPTGFVNQRYLWLRREEFRILEWSDSVVVARAETRAADIELRISLTDRAAERILRETGDRGAQLADPGNIGHWILD
jgi:hypothetical protein